MTTEAPNDGPSRTTRREAITVAGSGAALAALAAIRLTAGATAQGGTPVPSATPGAGTINVGLYVVIRSRKVKAGKSIDELTRAINEGLVPLIRAIPGFVAYDVIQNTATRDRASISIFTTKGGADASTRQASAFLTGHGLADYYENVTPDVKEGTVVISASAAGGG